MIRIERAEFKGNPKRTPFREKQAKTLNGNEGGKQIQTWVARSSQGLNMSQGMQSVIMGCS
jgi:hypothetical protein